MGTHVHLESRGKVGILTFSPDKKGKPPTIDLQVLEELENCLQSIRTNQSSYRVLVVQSSSPKYFIVGANIEALKKINKDSIFEWVQRGHKVFNDIEELPLPVIVKIQGYALGGGLELALSCDLIAATGEAQFGQPEASLGLIPGWGATFRLPRRIGTAGAKELFFTGKKISATEAYRCRLIDFVGSEEEVEEYITESCRGIINNSPVALDMIKRLSKKSITSGQQVMACEEAIASSVCISSGDTQYRLNAFFQNREKKV